MKGVTKKCLIVMVTLMAGMIIVGTIVHILIYVKKLPMGTLFVMVILMTMIVIVGIVAPAPIVVK